MRILVSDNSTEEEEVKQLSDFCTVHGHSLSYIRPPQSLSMTAHWDWAMQKAVKIAFASHITYLTDRTIFLNGSIAELEEILQNFGDKPVCFSNDAIQDNNVPVTLCRRSASGKLYEVKSSHLIEQFAKVNLIYPAMPRMMNCAVPIHMFEAIRSQYGNYFTSVSPDFNFGFRILNQVDALYFYDKALQINYAVARSNGLNLPYGVNNKDTMDFEANMSVHKVSFDTPVSDMAIVPNCIIHEYIEVASSDSRTKFVEIDSGKYFTSLIENVYGYRDPTKKKDMLSKLRASIGRSGLLWYRLLGRYRCYSNALRIRYHNLINPGNRYLWLRHFGTSEEALSCANECQEAGREDRDFLKERFGGIGPGVRVLRDGSEVLGHR